MSLRRFLIHDVGRLIPDKMWIQIKYLQWFKKLPNLKHPTTYNEKLNWLKLYDHRPEYIKMVDKYEAKQYIANRVGSQYVIPLVGGPWRSVEEIDWDSLPKQFVLKTTHDCGGVVVCTDKDAFDRAKAVAFLARHMRNNYYYTSREWPYKNVTPRIIAEAYVTDGTAEGLDGEQKKGQLTDYKFFCFDGEVKAMFVATERADQTTETKFDFFDTQYNHLPVVQGHPNAAISPAKPKQFEEMKVLAAKLSKGFPHVRVDFYEVNGQIYVGELTLYHFSGLVPFVPDEWDDKIGSWLTLPEKTKRKRKEK